MRRLGWIFLCGIALLMQACSHNNNGDEKLWGTWQLVSFVVDGEEATGYSRDYFWKFQADVILIQVVDEDMHEHLDYYGTFAVDYDADALTLYFNHSDDEYGPSEGVYSPPVGIGITSPVTLFRIMSMKNGKMVLSATSASGKSYTYYLERFF